MKCQQPFNFMILYLVDFKFHAMHIFRRIKCSLANPNYSFEIVTSSFIGNSTKVIPYESNAAADPFTSSFDPSLPIDQELLHPNRFREPFQPQ